LSSVTIVFYDIKAEDGIKRRGDFFRSVGDFSFEKDTIGHIFTGQYYGLHLYQAIKVTGHVHVYVYIDFVSVTIFLK